MPPKLPRASALSKCTPDATWEPDTRIFSPAMVAGLCDTIGRQLNESKRLEALRTIAIYRLEHIRANDSGKVVAKSAPAPLSQPTAS